MTTKKATGYWVSINRGKRGIKSTCCPDKAHYAHGMCKKCYYKSKWDNDPEWRARQQSLAKVRETERPPARTRNYDDLRVKTDAKFYNLLPGDREKIWAYQNGFDPISGMPLVASANLDHCHKTGLVRGLLNPITNKFLVDDVTKLEAMLKYLQNPPAPAALGERVFGLMGQAKHKKQMKYGPDGGPVPMPRKAAQSATEKEA